jgi:hypothetical protein
MLRYADRDHVIGFMKRHSCDEIVGLWLLRFGVTVQAG